MSDTTTIQTKSISTQLNNAEEKISNTEDYDAAAIFEKNNLKVVRGIVYSILFSIPIWLIIIMLVIWLV